MAPIATADINDSVLDTPANGFPSSIKAPSPPCLVTDFIRYQVNQHPDAFAVHVENETPYTYGALWQLVEQIAAKAPFVPGDIVPVCMDPTVEFVASLLAIMACGAAYVVLDPNGSAERNRAIAEDCDAGVVIVHEKYESNFERALPIEKVLSHDVTVSEAFHKVLLHGSVGSPSELAYLVYTSGSTGTPKGVLLSHRAASHGIRQFDLNGHRRWLLFYNPVFSAAQRTILATLAKGACLCLARRDRLATALPEVLSNLQIDALGITPSALSLLSPDEVPHSLKQITTVGEPLSQSLVNLWADKIKLRVSYGLSECAQLNFSRQLQPGEDPRNPGRPTDTTMAVIWEPGTTRQLPVGEPGELCLSGPQVANGYRNRPKETTTAFVKNGSDILFRTGDLAVHLPDDTIQILGRIDHQIKIHGQRVEPGEVAAKLYKEDVDGVAEIVCFGAHINEKMSLVAAVIPRPQTSWSHLVKDLRDQARRLFPPYMVPSYWLQCQDFPLNHNGKIDFKAIQKVAELADVESLLGRDAKISEGKGHTFSEIEWEIVETWADVLHLDQSSILPSDSFVGLGGTSIEAIKTLRELRTRGIHIELADLLQYRSVGDIADEVKVSGKGAAPDQFKTPEPFSLLSDETLKAELLADRGVVDAFPPTALQEGILASTLQGSQDYLYHRVFDVRHLDLVRLQLAFQVAYCLSDTYRSTFVTTTNGFAQVVRQNLPIPWTRESTSLSKYLEKDKNTGVTLGEPFMRVALLNEAILVVSVHHALFDYSSHGFMFDDISRLYFGQLPEPRASWKSFVGYLHDQSQKKESDEFWRMHLADAESTILNHSPVHQASSVSRTLPLDLKSVAVSLHAPASAIIYTAWALILSSHTASKSVTMAMAVSGRDVPVPGIERLDGPTLAVVPQAVVIDPKQSLVELVQSVNANLWEITKHSQHGIRGALAAAGHQGSSPLFDTMVNILVQEQDGDEITKEVFQTLGKQPAWKTEYTTLNIQMGVDGLEITLTGAMEERRLGFIMEQFCCAVETIIHTPRQSIESVSLMRSEELDFLLGWKEEPQDPTTLHGQFELIAEKHPSKVALNYQNEKILSYAELDEVSNRMANHLSEYGVAAGDVVPVLLEKSPFMISTILALLKLGAAYVPLSPENPVERNAFIVRDVGASCVVTETEHASFFDSEPECVPLVLVDTAKLCAYSREKPEIDVSPTALAYIIYTSGSTGHPKGVMVNHGACAAAMRSIIDFEKRQNKPIKHLQFSNFIFDASIYDIFATLHSGGTLCLASSERLLSDLAGVINEMGVNHVFMTPTVARLLDPKTVPTLESMVVGGEPLTPDVMATWASRITLINAYGPTEAAVMVTMKNASDDLHMSTGNIGTAFPSVGTVILEQDGVRPVPYGAVGELCFWGPQLSSGYLNRPEITAAAFIESEICGGQRLYRSGDLGRYIPGGDIECLGRKDDQVKINGHRIELGEIEQAILRTGVVRECVLTVWKQNNTGHLVATVIFDRVKEDGGVKKEGDFLPMDMVTEEAQRLKANLGGLAFYMFPKFILPLPSFPLLPSGKVNRKELKARVQSLTQADLTPYSFDNIGGAQSAEIIPVVSDEQKALQQGWIEVLQLPHDRFGLEASFLSLGGDSIFAINLVSWLRRKGLGISVRDVLRYPLLGSMAEHLHCEDESDEAAAASASQTLVFSPPSELDPIISSAGLGRDDYEYIYPCPPGQAEFLSQGARPERFWCLMTVRSLGQNSNPTQWLDLVKQLTKTNDILRTTFIKHAEKWYGVVLPDPTPVVEFHDVQTPSERKNILDTIWSEEFVFGKPFIRYAILRLAYADNEHQVVTKLDHGLYDGTLLRVFDAHFQKYQRGEALEDFTSFKDFALHIWKINQTRPTLSFWQQPDKQPIHFQIKSRQNHNPKRQQQPSPGPNIDAFAVHIIQHDKLETYSRSSGVTVSILFQAIFQIWLSLRSTQQDVAFDYLYTGRNVDLPDPQNINGTCANFLPMRSKVDMATRFTDFLLQTQDEFWQYTENSTVGIDDIYRSCGEGGMSREECTNQALFLFQPFEPAPAAPSSTTSSSSAPQPQRWLVMAKSEITMPEPYAVVFEVIRTESVDRYKVKFAYDSSFWSKEEVEAEFGVVEKMVSRVVEEPDVLVGDVLRGL